MILGERACCLKCMAAWILLDPTQKPIFGRDLNTHMAEYRSYYKDQPSFPVTITIAGREWKSVWGGGRRWLLWYFSILTWSLIYVPQYDCSDKLHQNVCWSDCLWPRIKKIKEPTHQYNPDPDFPWKESDTNSPNENKYTKMHLPNYKMFTLIFLASPERHPDPTAESLRKYSEEGGIAPNSEHRPVLRAPRKGKERSAPVHRQGTLRPSPRKKNAWEGDIYI